DGQRRIAGSWTARECSNRRIRRYRRIGTGEIALDWVALKCVGCADVDRGSVACGTSTSPNVARDEGELPSRREGGHCKSQVARNVLKTERGGHVQVDGDGSVRSDHAGGRARTGGQRALRSVASSRLNGTDRADVLVEKSIVERTGRNGIRVPGNKDYLIAARVRSEQVVRHDKLGFPLRVGRRRHLAGISRIQGVHLNDNR